MNINESLLRKENGLEDGLLTQVLGVAAEVQIDDAEIYAERVAFETFQLEDSMIKTTSHQRSQGAGVRAISGTRFGYAHANDLAGSALLDAARTARAIARDCTSENRTTAVALSSATPTHSLYPVQRSPLDGPVTERVELLHAIDERARAVDSRVTQVIASLATEDKEILVARLDGRVVVDRRPLCRLDVSVIVEDGVRKESGRCGGGGRHDFSVYAEPGALGARSLWEYYVDEAVRQALVLLDAKEAPAGVFPVVLGPGWPGVLLHEAIGHGLEGDFNRKGTSAFSGRIGERVAHELCTIVDDGTLTGRRGSLNVDDEGTQTQRTVLIEDGILKQYMTDRMNARLMGTSPTGNGRRQSYAHAPMPRMTNTFMLAGPHDPEEIIKSVNYGIYAVSFGGGQVDITSGKFVFSASEAYLIEDGRVTAPIRGATLIGDGPDVLTKVSMVGADMALDRGVGTCGKDGQSVPVCVGLPTVKVDELTVGGTQA